MVHAHMTLNDGKKALVHWPRDFTPEEMQRRVCKAFKRSAGDYWVKFTYEGYALRDKVPFFLMARRNEKVNIGVVFELLSDSKRCEVEMSDDDVSTGYSTSSEIAEEVDRLDAWGCSLDV